MFYVLSNPRNSVSSLVEAQKCFYINRPWQRALKMTLFPAELMNIHELVQAVYSAVTFAKQNSQFQVSMASTILLDL